MLYQFSDFELDAEKFELRRDGKAQHVEPLVFDLLHFLCKNPDRVIGLDEFIEKVWKGRIVSDVTVSGCVKSARKALGDSGETPQFIKTVRGRGFQFIASVDASAGTSPQPGTMTPKKQSSMVILPFQVFGEDKELGVVSEGLVENLTTILTRVPLLSLISRSSSFALKEEDRTAERMLQMFGATYMLEGSIQQIGENVRANIQLIATKSGYHCWAHQFECPFGPLMMNDLLHSILAQLEPQLIRAMVNDLQGESDQQSSRQLLLRAMSLLTLKGWHRNTFIEASELLRLSIDLEPDLALAHGYLALILALGHRVGLLRKSEAIVAEAVGEANIALDLDDMDSEVVGLAACALADVGHVERAIPLLRKAAAINPNNGQAFAALGAVLGISGFPEEAVEKLVHGIEISPMDKRVAVWGTFLTLVYVGQGEFDLALEAAQNACQADDNNYLPKVALTAVRLARDETDEAIKVLTECYRVKPDLTQQEIACIAGPDMGAAMEKLRTRIQK